MLHASKSQLVERPHSWVRLA